MNTGTSGKKAIPTHGGFQFSEFNIQKHVHPRGEESTFYEDSRSSKQYAGRDPLNPPFSTNETNQKLYHGMNKAYGWREPTLHTPVPGQVATSTKEMTARNISSFQGRDVTLLGRSVRHGFGQNDPALQHLLSDDQISPSVVNASEYLYDPYLHSDIGVPSVVTQNMMNNPTKSVFPVHKKQYHRGKHDHLGLKHERTPAMRNNSHTGTNAHHTHAVPPHPVVNGFRATRGPLERPLLLSDLPMGPTPQIRPEEWPGLLEKTTNRAVFLVA
jgi:hypothetical protein